MIHVNDMIMVSGCGADNFCKTCSNNCHKYVEGDCILAKVCKIISLNYVPLPMDKVFFIPIAAKSDWNIEANFTRRKWCRLAKDKPDHIFEVLL